MCTARSGRFSASALVYRGYLCNSKFFLFPDPTAIWRPGEASPAVPSGQAAAEVIVRASAFDYHQTHPARVQGRHGGGNVQRDRDEERAEEAEEETVRLFPTTRPARKAGLLSMRPM